MRKRKIMRLILLLLSIFISTTTMANNAHNFKFNLINSSEEIKLSDFKGKVVMIVNTASECGFTSQYADLEELYKNYKDKGLIIIAVPSNDFAQEPGTDQEIQKFIQDKYNVTFLVARKEIVKGDNAHPFYIWAKEITGNAPSWNFYKYVVGKDGEIVDYFIPLTSPSSKKIKTLLENNL
jgi:glutathione peroxidase